jgi:hypothetical protein
METPPMVDENKITPAFMMIFNPTGYNSFIPAPYYISEKLNDYINTNKKGKVEYIIIPEEDGIKTIHVMINNFDYVKAGLNGEYNDFYECSITLSLNIKTDLIRERKEINYISFNKDKLRNFCGYINRLTN